MIFNSTYSNREIVEGINRIFPHLQVTDREFPNLCSMKTIEFYRSLLYELEVDAESVTEKILVNYPYSSSLRNSLYVCVIYNFAKQIYTMINKSKEKFQLCDLLKPRSKRVAPVIKTFMKFFFYVENAELVSLIEEILTDRDFVVNCDKLLNNYKEEYNQIVIEISKCDEFIKSQMEEIRTLVKECSKHLKEEEQFIKTNLKQKHSLKELEKEKYKCKKILQNSLKNEKELQTLVTSDYELLNMKHKNLTVQNDELKTSIKHLLDRISTTDTDICTLNKLLKLSETMIQEDQLSTLIEKYNTLGKIEILNLKATDDIYKKSAFKKKLEISTTNNTILEIEDGTHTLKTSMETSKQNMQEDTQIFEKEYNGKINYKNLRTSQAHAFHHQIHALKLCCQQYEERFKTLSSFFQDQYKFVLVAKTEMYLKFDKYFQELNSMTKFRNEY